MAADKSKGGYDNGGYDGKSVCRFLFLFFNTNGNNGGSSIFRFFLFLFLIDDLSAFSVLWPRKSDRIHPPDPAEMLTHQNRTAIMVIPVVI